MRAIAGSLVAVERKIVQAFKHGKSDPLAALGEFLAAAETAGQQLARTPPGNTAVRDACNFAVTRGFTTIREAKLDPWT